MVEENNSIDIENDTNLIKRLYTEIKDIIIRTFTGHSTLTWFFILIFLIIAGITAVLLLFQIQDETWLFSIVINYFAIPILNLQEVGWILYIAFMGIQGILMPIPSELILISSGLIYGPYFGTLLGLIGSMFAGILTYYISVKGGRPLAEKFVGEKNIALLDNFIEKHGGWIIILFRAFPIIPFDPVSYASGLVKIKARTYIIATFIGSVIRCFFYALVGSFLIPSGVGLMYYVKHPAELELLINEGSAAFNFILLLLIVSLGAAFLAYQFLLMPYLKKKNEEIGKTKEIN
ncbi:MAG: TVP38/TMEM64 family protein [archaeon]|nr:TVP38/TMEM64 family protein [archaeon]